MRFTTGTFASLWGLRRRDLTKLSKETGLSLLDRRLSWPREKYTRNTLPLAQDVRSVIGSRELSARAALIADWKKEILRLPPFRLSEREYIKLRDGSRKVAIFEPEKLLWQTRQTPVARRATQMVAVVDALALSIHPECHPNRDNSDWSDKGYNPASTINLGKIFDTEVLQYQDPEVIEWIQKNGRPFIQSYDLSAENKLDRIPHIKAMFAEALWDMITYERENFAYEKGIRYIAMTRQELIDPARDMRSGQTLHYDTDLFGATGVYEGKFAHSWMVWSHMPTEGYLFNRKDMPLKDVMKEVDMRQA